MVQREKDLSQMMQYLQYFVFVSHQRDVKLPRKEPKLLSKVRLLDHYYIAKRRMNPRMMHPQMMSQGMVGPGGQMQLRGQSPPVGAVPARPPGAPGS